MKTPSWSTLDAMSEKELLLGLGRECVGDDAVPQSLGTLIDRGRDVLQKAEPHLKAIICQAGSPKASLSDLPEETLKTTIIAMISGATVGLNFTHVALFYVTALIVRRSLAHYCATNDGPPKDSSTKDVAAL